MLKKENRYMTRNIVEDIPLEIKYTTMESNRWITNRKGLFTNIWIKPIGEGIVEIVHKQEIPEYEASIYIHNEAIKESKKIYAIDSIEYSTLMFSHEY